jgi:hypothetical protein
MPKTHNFKCKNCSRNYKGQNNEFCSRECFYVHKSGVTNHIDLSDCEKNILDGVIFGDGNLVKQSINTSLRFEQSIKNKDYVLWLASILGYQNKIYEKDIILNGKKYKNTGFCTRSCPVLNSFYDRWYKDKQKKIPEDFTLSADLLMHLYLSDGCLDNLPNNRYRIRLALCCFDLEQVKTFVQELLNIGIETKINLQGKNKYPIVAIQKQASVAKLLKYIGRINIPCFDYKFRIYNNQEWLNKYFV